MSELSRDWLQHNDTL